MSRRRKFQPGVSQRTPRGSLNKILRGDGKKGPGSRRTASRRLEAPPPRCGGGLKATASHPGHPRGEGSGPGLWAPWPQLKRFAQQCTDLFGTRAKALRSDPAGCPAQWSPEYRCGRPGIAGDARAGSAGAGFARRRKRPKKQKINPHFILPSFHPCRLQRPSPTHVTHQENHFSYWPPPPRKDE